MTSRRTPPVKPAEPAKTARSPNERAALRNLLQREGKLVAAWRSVLSFMTPGWVFGHPMTEEDWSFKVVADKLRQTRLFSPDLEASLQKLIDTTIILRDHMFSIHGTSLEDQLSYSSLLHAALGKDPEVKKSFLRQEGKFNKLFASLQGSIEEDEDGEDAEDDEEPRPKKKADPGTRKSASNDPRNQTLRLMRLDLSPSRYSRFEREQEIALFSRTLHCGAPWVLGDSSLSNFEEIGVYGKIGSENIEALRPLTGKVVLYPANLVSMVHIDSPSSITEGLTAEYKRTLSEAKLYIHCFVPLEGIEAVKDGSKHDGLALDARITDWIYEEAGEEVVIPRPMVQQRGIPAWILSVLCMVSANETSRKESSGLLAFLNARASLAEDQRAYNLRTTVESKYRDYKNSLNRFAPVPSELFRNRKRKLDTAKEAYGPPAFADTLGLSFVFANPAYLQACADGILNHQSSFIDGSDRILNALIDYLFILSKKVLPRKNPEESEAEAGHYIVDPSADFQSAIHVLWSVIADPREAPSELAAFSPEDSVHASSAGNEVWLRHPYLSSALGAFVFGLPPETLEEKRIPCIGGGFKREPKFSDLWSRATTERIAADLKKTSREVETLMRSLAEAKLRKLRLDDTVRIMEEAARNRMNTIVADLQALDVVKEVVDSDNFLMVETIPLHWKFKSGNHMPLVIGPLRIFFEINGTMAFQAKKTSHDRPIPNAFGWDSICLGSFQEAILTAIGSGDFARAVMYFVNWATNETDSYGRGYAESWHDWSMERILSERVRWSSRINVVQTKGTSEEPGDDEDGDEGD